MKMLLGDTWRQETHVDLFADFSSKHGGNMTDIDNGDAVCIPVGFKTKA